MRRIVAGLVEAIDRTQAVMEFNPDETILTANDNRLVTTTRRFGRRSIAGSAMRASSELVHQSGKRLDEIVTTVKRVTDIIGEISAASQEAGERDRPGEQGHCALPPATASPPSSSDSIICAYRAAIVEQPWRDSRSHCDEQGIAELTPISLSLRKFASRSLCICASH